VSSVMKVLFTQSARLYLTFKSNSLFSASAINFSASAGVPFAPDGETIVFTREKPNDTREFWSVDPRGTKLKKFDAAPDWYSATKSSPYFTNLGEEENESSPSASQAAPREESPSAAATPESAEQGEHQSVTALDAVANAKDRPPEIIKAPDGSGEIFWRKGEDKEDPLDFALW